MPVSLPLGRLWPAVSVAVAWTMAAFAETTAGATKGACVAVDCSRGRQYELGRSEAGTGRLTFENFDGRYTAGAGNAAAPAPVAGNLGLYKEYRIQATWNSVIYDVARGFVERWPTSYSDAGNFAWADVTTVDAFAILGGQQLRSAADHEVLADSPSCLYRLDEAAGSRTVGDSINPGSNHAGVLRASKYGAGTVAFGSATGLVDGAAGVAFTSSATTGTIYTPCTALVLAYGTTAAPFVPAATGWSVELWVKTPSVVPATGQWTLMLQSSEQGQDVELAIATTGGVNLDTENPAGLINFNPITATNICDGGLHHIVAVLGADRKTTTVYVDGVLASTYTAPSAYVFDQLRYHCLGARVTSSPVQGYQFPGTIARYAIYPAPLTGARILAHYQAGATGFAGEDEGARITRLLGYAGWSGALTDIGVGASQMGAALTAGVSALQAIQDAADDTLGNLWVSGAGKVTFRSRAVRQTTTASALTFGENVPAGEFPYLQDVNFDFDPSYVISQATVTRTGGVTVTATNATTPLPYPKTLPPREIAVLRDAEATDQANWLLAQYANPRQRVAALSIDPSSNPSLWAVALGTEINTRVTVKRRALNQPAFSIDCWVEAVAHKVSASRWLTTFLLSPVDSPRALLWELDNWDDPNAVWAF